LTETRIKPLASNKKTQAVAYLRTSSATNVGSDKDSDKRQRDAIVSFARRAGYELVEEFNDPGVSGADPIESRPGFSALLDQIEENGVRVVIVEDASRFARDLITQELGILALIERKVTVLTATGDDLTTTDDPMKKAMRQIAGTFAELEKARLVHKLKVARDRKRATGAKVEGRKSFREMDAELVTLAKKLHRYPVNGKRRSLRDIAQELAAAGHLDSKGKVYSAQSIKNMIEG
jgi:DNA invertase Pin-like site-specific DNA recombinase